MLLFSGGSVVDAFRAATVVAVASAVAPLAAAEILALRVALGRSRSVGERKFGTAPPIFAPKTNPVLYPVRIRSIVGAGGTTAVGVSRAAIPPLTAAGVCAGAVALTW